MKKILFAIIGLILVSGLFSENLGKAADFTLEDADGNQVSLTQFGDKLIVLDFWATWCVPCVKELPHLSVLQEKYGDDIQILAITIDKARSVSKAKAFVKSNSFNFITLLDPNKEVAQLYNMVNPPRTMMIDPNLNVIFSHDGYKAGDEVHMEEVLVEWIENKDKHKPELAGGIGSQLDSNLSITGINEAKYVYNNAPDSLKQYLHEEFNFNVIYNNFRFGMGYEGKLPKYEKYEPYGTLDSDNVDSEWVNRYVEFNNGELRVRGGKFDALIGSGMILSAYDNTDLDKDYRLDGFYGKYRKENYQIQAFYGVLPTEDENYVGKYDLVNGVDFSVNPIKKLTVGAAAISQKLYQDGEEYDYNIREVYSGRLGYAHDKFEIKAEYAESKQYHLDSGLTEYGTALYSDLNIYAGQFTITGAYKNYKDFVSRLNELPTCVNSDEPLVDYNYDVGSDEEGFMGVLRYVPNDKNEVILNAGYGWSDRYDIEQFDFHAEYKRNFANWTLTSEYDQIENKWLSGTTDVWTKHFAPALIADFVWNDFSYHTKAAFTQEKHISYENEEHETNSYEPLFQMDMGKGIYSVSLLTSYKYYSSDDIMDYTPKIGVELFVQAFKHTDLKFFVGSEKGGLVCRNGVCNYQAPFEGARINVVTRF